MTTRQTLIVGLALITVVIAGCSTNPVSSAPPKSTNTTAWNSSGAYWISTVNATSATVPAYYSFSKHDTTTPGVSDSLWNVGLEQSQLMTNSGVSADGGDDQGIALTSTNFAGVTAADTVGKSWQVDRVGYFINNWCTLDTTSHLYTNLRNVYTMNDATGHHFIKFRIDSLVNAGAAPNMGTVYLTYYYNPTADSTKLTGTTAQAAIPVGGNTVYFSFSAGAVVTPANPKTSTEWDLLFSNYNVGQNSGPNGPVGRAAAFYAFQYLADPTDINAVHDIYAGQQPAPLFQDAASSIFDNWYNYDITTHTLTSKNLVYLLKSAGKLYKMQIYSIYADVGGVPVLNDYIFYWAQI